MSRRFLRNSTGLLFAWVLIGAIPLLAHDSPIDHIERVVQIFIEGGKVHVVYRFRSEERQIMLQLNQMDKDHDGKISDAERKTYFKSQAAELTSQLYLEIDGKELTLAPEGDVQLSPDLSQTFILTSPLEALTSGTHTGRFTDNFSRTHPGPYRWSPRQINSNGITVDAAKPPAKAPPAQHDSMIAIDLKIEVKASKAGE